MTYNKSKAQESALKYLQQGKLAQAIAEYQQILKHEPKDQSTLMTLGDLHVRQGDTQRATDCFERLANVFLHDGFNSKAIAIYKKIAKLAPAETSPLERLAELYVQQGVLSEARTLFLQLAEIYMKANRSQQAVEALQKLLEVEPDNHRVQLKLADLYHAMGQKKEAALVCVSFARRLLDRGEVVEAQKLVDKALAGDPGNVQVILLKAQALSAGGQTQVAISLLESHSDSTGGGEMTAVFLDLLLKSGDMPRAVSLAQKVLARGRQHYQHAYAVASALLEAGKAEDALNLLEGIRDVLIESGEQEQLAKALTSAAEQLPGSLEPREWLVDLYRKTSDSFRLADAVKQLAEAYSAAGRFKEAEALYQELLERNPENEELLKRLNQARTQTGREPVSVSSALEEEAPAEEPAAPVVLPEPTLDEDTQRYVTQALTDVDLFSSYGLAQKAVQLLETVLQRVPHHTPTLERLLDLCVGAGNEQRIAEIAARLEKIYTERGDTANADRFGEFRRRFQRAAGIPAEAVTDAQPVATDAPAPAEFAVSPVELPAVEEPMAEMPSIEPQAPPVPTAIAPPVIAQPSVEAAPVPEASAETDFEIDLTEDWASLAEEIEKAGTTPGETPASTLPAEAEPAETPAGNISSLEEAFDFELELVPSTAGVEEKEEQSAMSQDQFLSELAAEVEELERLPEEAAAPASSAAAPAAPKAPAASNGDNVDQLHDVFQDFRTELEEIGEEDEDLETHYNLGIAYREMGLLDEAIGEFQKVAKSVQNGRPFRYAMQCSTLLGLTFMAKNEPKIAAVWYQRALETPGLDQESILALRYDLGVAQELAGESAAALESFRQVYAMNIDYRDVAERIASIPKH
jgi:pilus assembly protein FimV